MDANRQGDYGRTIRVCRTIVVVAIQRLGIGDGRYPEHHQHPLLQRNGTPH
jgi:hypothetical protein